MERGSFYKNWKERLPKLLTILCWIFMGASIATLFLATIPQGWLEYFNILSLNRFEYSIISLFFFIFSLLCIYTSQKIEEAQCQEKKIPCWRRWKEWLPNLLIIP